MCCCCCCCCWCCWYCWLLGCLVVVMVGGDRRRRRRWCQWRTGQRNCFSDCFAVPHRNRSPAPERNIVNVAIRGSDNEARNAFCRTPCGMLMNCKGATGSYSDALTHREILRRPRSRETVMRVVIACEIEKYSPGRYNTCARRFGSASPIRLK